MATERLVDVAIIGAGTAGLSACHEVQKATDKFVLINGGASGTTCARVGCMPSKVLIQVANDFQRRHVFATEGIFGGEALRVDRAAVLAYVRALRDHFVQGVLKTVEKLGDHYMPGYARFREPTVLDVDGECIRARCVIIATGSRPMVPQSWQAFSDRILTTDTLFEQETLPDAITVIGLGVVGVEIGQALARLGLQVTGVTQSKHVGGITDPEVDGYVQRLLAREFPLHADAVAEVQSMDTGLSVHFAGQTLVADRVVASLGRRPNVAALELEKLGLPLNKQGLPPYDPTTMQVRNLPVFIAGDVNADHPVLHEASDEGRIAGFNSVQEESHCFQRRTPLSIVFCEPNVAVVGSSFAALQDQHIAIGEARFDNQGRARIMAENAGILRVYADKDNGRLLGAELATPAGEHLAHLLAWAIQQQLSVFDMLQLPFYHPVVEEGLRTALRNLSKQVKDKRSGFELAFCDSSAVGEME